jgi:EAL domain-containing protein (putative c-di-GMP-specific phosphodiesterase class I)
LTVSTVAPLPLARATASAVLTMHFQPIVDLQTEAVVGYEALARGPAGSPWECPQDLFAQARAEGRLREMDWACRVAAIREIHALYDRRPTWRLFVNTEPEVLGSICPEDLLADWIGGTGDLEVVVEVTERALMHGPRRLLAAVQELRDFGCEIALDDVGSNEPSVALLPLIEPDVVKLDAALLLETRGAAGVTALRAVQQYADRTGAVVVAEGIESEQQRAAALALGAQWGQGYHFARPRSLEPGDVSGRRDAARQPSRGSGARAPLGRHRDLPRLVVPTDWVTERLAALTTSAAADAAVNVFLVRLPDPSITPPGYFDVLAELQQSCALTAVVVGDVPAATTPPLRPPEHAWDDVIVVVLGPAVAKCMTAHRADDDRYVVTLDDDVAAVVATARQFLGEAG